MCSECAQRENRRGGLRCYIDLEAQEADEGGTTQHEAQERVCTHRRDPSEASSQAARGGEHGYGHGAALWAVGVHACTIAHGHVLDRGTV